jgi:hypothetical protein
MSDERTIFLLASDWQTAQTQYKPIPRWKFLGLTTDGNTTIRRYSVILDDSPETRGLDPPNLRSTARPYP